MFKNPDCMQCWLGKDTSVLPNVLTSCEMPSSTLHIPMKYQMSTMPIPGATIAPVPFPGMVQGIISGKQMFSNRSVVMKVG